MPPGDAGVALWVAGAMFRSVFPSSRLPVFPTHRLTLLTLTPHALSARLGAS